MSKLAVFALWDKYVCVGEVGGGEEGREGWMGRKGRKGGGSLQASPCVC